MAATTVVGLATPSYAIGDVLTSVVPARGPSGGGNTIVLTTPGADYTASPSVQFSWTTCADSSPAAADPAANATAPYALTAGIVNATPTILGNAKQLSVTVPSSIALLTSQTTATWNVCVYAAAGTAQTLLSKGTYTIQGQGLSLSSNYGPSGGGNQIQGTVPGTLPTSGLSVQYQYVASTPANAWCTANPQTVAAPAATAGSPPPQTAGVIAGTATVSSGKLNLTVPAAVALTTSPAQSSARYNVCVYSGAGLTAPLVAGTITPYTIAGKVLNLNTTKGPIGAASTVLATLPGNATFSAGATASIQFAGTGTRGGCAATYLAGEGLAGSLANGQTAGVVISTDVRNLGDRLSITVPSTAAAYAEQASAPYNVCVYSGSSIGTSPLVAGTTTPLVLANPATITAVTPTAGNAQGGTEITVFGTNFSKDMTATVGGSDLKITSVADNGTSFVAVAPAHAVGGPFAITVSTPGGTVNATGLFSYTNGITVSPNTAPNTKLSASEISIKGTGFSSLTFVPGGSDTNGTTPNAASPHVYLVRGQYDEEGTAGTTFKANGQTAECLNVLPLGDTELLCSLYLAGNGPTPQPSTAACATCAVAAVGGGTNVMTSTTAFTRNMVGMTVTDTGAKIPAGTTIVSVTDASTAILSNVADPAGAAATTITLNQAKTLNGTTATTAGSTTLTATGLLADTDIGRTIVGPGIQAGTTIVSQNATNTAVLSKPATSDALTAASFTIGGYQVPTGTYTVTVVSSGATDAADVVGGNYQQSIISSGSTFTVANY
ncbi:beta strand repeat-containing protein [Paractinoplanes hotanensis]|uniref:IPT/TIG domain-containing protein n=1 Tax=Paractinoplanes hotanensis TaxID=2906497 RepID=A0ABT0YCJ6_9ACTN|nr:IPT/TIG domain-containing protein [Actinoplanes hotanensis]MCM4083771.1 IPT/TIG domain-containing protein [Actinoplanes hotanensis]